MRNWKTRAQLLQQALQNVSFNEELKGGKKYSITYLPRHVSFNEELKDTFSSMTSVLIVVVSFNEELKALVRLAAWLSCPYPLMRNWKILQGAGLIWLTYQVSFNEELKVVFALSQQRYDFFWYPLMRNWKIWTIAVKRMSVESIL